MEIIQQLPTVENRFLKFPQITIKETEALVTEIYNIKNEIERLSYLCPKVWNSIPTELKENSSLETFKESIKLWKPLHYTVCKGCLKLS